MTALAWWWLIFRQVVGFDYLTIPRATVCLGISDTICDLAMSLCSSKHPFGLRYYDPMVLWIGLALSLAGFAAKGVRHP